MQRDHRRQPGTELRLQSCSAVTIGGAASGSAVLTVATSSSTPAGSLQHLRDRQRWQ
jgi:hypothetical protein